MGDNMDNNEEMLSSYLEAAPDIPEDTDGVLKEELNTKEDDKKENKDENKEEDIDGGIDSEGKKDESGEDVVKRVKADLGIDKKTEEEKGSAIPAEFTKVCLAQGWSEDDIKAFAAGLDNDVLLEMIPEIIGDGDTKEKQTESKKSEDKSKSKSKITDDKTIDDSTKAELAVLKKEIEALKEGNKEKKLQDAKSQEEAMVVTVNQAFDQASEDFKIFGKTEELLRYPAGPKKGQVVMGTEAMVAREEVWKKAVPFVKSGLPIKEAMKIALTWFKGENLEKDVHRDVIKDLKRHEQKLSAKRTSKKTVKVYKDDDARKDAVVREAARKAGVKGNYGD